MIEEVFAAGNSLNHRIDPRARVAVAALLCFVIALSEKTNTLWAGLGFSLVLLAASRLNPIAVIKRIFVIWGFLLFLWTILPVTYEGEIIYRVGKLGISREGLELCARISLKSNAILIVFIALITTMDFSTLGYALNSFKLPGKLIHLLLLTYRYLFVIEQEYRRLARAMKIRCFKAQNSMHTYQTYAYLAGMLFVRASARAQRVYNAMKCRGFEGKFHCLAEFSFSRSDGIWTLAVLICTSGLIFIEVLT